MTFPFRELPPLSLYVHIPWCVRKCPYCDFNSHAAPEGLPEMEYVDALLRDLESELPLVWGRRLQTIFIGGGTPSLFSAEAIARLLAGVRALLPISPTAEITLEANPGAVENERLAGFREAGVNRLSLGVQSFADDKLAALGRIHSADEARRAVTMARAAGFDNLNLDLMFALPGQSLTAARADLEQALELAPEHLSYYQLTLEPNTLFAARPPALPAEPLMLDIHEQGLEMLAAAGYGRYEVSAFARSGRASRHNLNYWRFGDYIGIGAGAHGKLSHAQFGSIHRRWRVKNPRDYLAQPGQALSGEQALTSPDVQFEFLMNALRLVEGFALADYRLATTLDSDRLLEHLQPWLQQGLLVREGERIRASERGYALLDEILSRIVPD